MMNIDEQNNLFETVEAILLRCFFLSLVLICIWFGFYLFSSNAGYAFHSIFFACNQHDYDAINYFGIAFAKISAILFFLIPYLSIKWALRTRRKVN
jgi:hypothetical protein